MTEENQQPEESQEEKMKKLPNEGRPFLSLAVNADGEVIIQGWVHDPWVTDHLIAEAERKLAKMRAESFKPKIIKDKGSIIDFMRNGHKK